MTKSTKIEAEKFIFYLKKCLSLLLLSLQPVRLGVANKMLKNRAVMLNSGDVIMTTKSSRVFCLIHCFMSFSPKQKIIQSDKEISVTLKHYTELNLITFTLR